MFCREFLQKSVGNSFREKHVERSRRKVYSLLNHHSIIHLFESFSIYKWNKHTYSVNCYVFDRVVDEVEALKAILMDELVVRNNERLVLINLVTH